MNNILLDFDGVVLRNNNINKIIEEKSIDFVQNQLNLSHSKSYNINKRLYKQYGHTACGIAKIKNKNIKNMVLDYNNFIFENISFNDISSYLTEFDRDRIEYLVNNKKYKLGLFTNTPISWCENILSCLGIDVNMLFNSDNIFTSDLGYLKPESEAYNNVEKNLSCDEIIHFIDDSSINLIPIKNKKNWIPYLSNSDEIDDLINILENIQHSKKI